MLQKCPSEPRQRTPAEGGGEVRLITATPDFFPPRGSHSQSEQQIFSTPAAASAGGMDKLTIISGCLFLAADIFAIASIANPDWINTGESAGK